MSDDDAVFRALGEPARRRLLDLLHQAEGQTLSELCAPMDMSRQAVSQHLAVLEEANLVTTLWRGREKQHFLNPIPLHDIYARWVRKFERSRLDALHRLKTDLEGSGSK